MSRVAKYALIGAAALMCTVGLAEANGPRRAKEAPSLSWTGLYVGASAGSVKETAAWTVPGLATTPSGDDNGTLFGGTVGYNYQVASWLVVGLEGDWSNADVNIRPIPSCGGPCSTGVDWLGTLRGRAGVLMSPSTLIYGTAGFAWAGVHNSITTASVNDTANGWVVGGGIEIRFDKNWSVKAEYLRVGLDDTLACLAANCIDNNFATNHTLDIVRGGINFKF